MGKESRSAKKSRAALIKLLGGKCKLCGKRYKLEVDHIDGRDWQPRDLSSHCRVARYWREYEAGVRLRVLCRWCNAAKWPERKHCPEVPF